MQYLSTWVPKSGINLIATSAWSVVGRGDVIRRAVPKSEFNIHKDIVARENPEVKKRHTHRERQAQWSGGSVGVDVGDGGRGGEGCLGGAQVGGEESGLVGDEPGLKGDEVECAVLGGSRVGGTIGL